MFDRLGIGRQALANILGDIAYKYIFQSALERRSDYALATRAGPTFGGGTVWNHSISSGPREARSPP